MPERGRFVSLEGVEGSGKSTLCGRLIERLAGSGIAAIATREPGGTALGDRVRALFLDPEFTIDARAEALLVNAARAQLVAEVIEPRLAEGTWVLSDRFATSTLAYQGFGRGLGRETLRAMAAFATQGLEPDLVLLVDVPLEVSRARHHARPGADDRVEAESDAFHARVRDGYLELARDDKRIRILDGTLSETDLLEAAWREVAALSRTTA